MSVVRDLIDAMERIAPTSAAESWDNVGLLVGDADARLSRVLLTIDLTRAVLDEATAESCDAVVAYHPPLFEATKRFLAGSVAFEAVRRGVAIYSPHTALDAAEGGTNDVLAELLGLTDTRPLHRASMPRELKLVTFVPADVIDAVAAAVAKAGAGVMGNYTECSFRTAGVGTFRGGESSSPTVGKPGKFERVDEIKLETVVPIARVDAVLAALKAAHPYETPAFDLVQLEAPPSAIGIGRVGTLPAGTTRASLVDRLKHALGVEHVLVAGPLDGAAATVAVCAGSGGALLDAALTAGADVFVTGELRHHDALRAAAAGLTVVMTLHSVSERPTLARLADRLRMALPEVTFTRSARDGDPFRFV